MTANMTNGSGVARQRVHTRNIHMESFLRSDGLWDIEATLTDVRDYPSMGVERGQIPAGEALHDIHVCITVDNDLVVKDASATMSAHPYHTCPLALPSLAGLAGGTLARGWRKHVESQLGMERGCSHIREMLQQMATTAYQTVPVWWAQQNGDVIPSRDGKPPQHLGQCKAWSFDGPVVARIYPEFAGWQTPSADEPPKDPH